MRLRLLLVLLFACAVPMACSSDDDSDAAASRGKGSSSGNLACTPGDSKACSAACGSGFQECAADGSKYGSCQCGAAAGAAGAPPAAGAGGAPPAAGAAGAPPAAGAGGAPPAAGAGGAPPAAGAGGAPPAGGAAGTSAGGSGPSTCDTGSPGQTNCGTCGECANVTDCKPENDAANDNPEYADFVGCVAFCFDAACGEGCDKQYPVGSALYGAIVICQVCKVCPKTCVASKASFCK